MRRERRRWMVTFVAVMALAVLVVVGCGLLGVHGRGGVRPATGVIRDDVDPSRIALDDDPSAYFTLDGDAGAPLLTDLPRQPLEGRFADAATLRYPDQESFTPLLLGDDGVLYGQDAGQSGSDGTGRAGTRDGDAAADQGSQPVNGADADADAAPALGSYDLTDGSYTATVMPQQTGDGGGAAASLSVVAAGAGKVLVEHHADAASAGTYLLADTDGGDVRVVDSLAGVPSLHDARAAIDDAGIMINRYDTDSGAYRNEYHRFDGTVSVVESRDCSPAVLVNGSWWYLLFAGDDARQVGDGASGEADGGRRSSVRLIEFDATANTKTVRYVSSRGSDAEAVFVDMIAGGDRLVVVADIGGMARALAVDVAHGTITPLFDTAWIESPSCSGRYLTWAGERVSEGRVRVQYHLLDMATMTLLTQDTGEIFLHGDAIAWVAYHRADGDIGKGDVYTNRNSAIRYMTGLDVDGGLTVAGEGSADDGRNDGGETGTDGDEGDNGDEAGLHDPSALGQGLNGGVDGGGAGGDGAGGVRLDVPQSVQETGYWCVPAALQMVLRHHGIDVSQRVLAERMHTQPATGTEYVDLARTANAYLFGVDSAEPAGVGYRVQTVAVGDRSRTVADTFERRVRADLAAGDPVFVAIDVQALYPWLGRGNHMIVITGYDTDSSGAITRYRYLDPSFMVQDATYGGLKTATADELVNAIIVNEEPAYVW